MFELFGILNFLTCLMSEGCSKKLELLYNGDWDIMDGYRLVLLKCRDISMEKISNVALGLGFGWVFKTMCR